MRVKVDSEIILVLPYVLVYYPDFHIIFSLCRDGQFVSYVLLVSSPIAPTPSP